MTIKYFVPISLEALPEYLGSSFIGLLASKEPKPDLQTESFPDVKVVNSLNDVQSNVALEIEVDAKANATEREAGFEILQGPVSMGRVCRIIFGSESEKDNCLASYKHLPDLPLNLFDIEVAELGGVACQTEIEKPEESGSVQDDGPRGVVGGPRFGDPRSLVAFTVALKESAVFGETHLGDLGDSFSIDSIDPDVLAREFINHLLPRLGYVDKISKASFVLLDYYLRAVEDFGRSNKIEPASLLNSMKRMAEQDSENTGSAPGLNAKSVTKFVDKSQKIMIGLEQRPVLDDDPFLVLKRAIYLACNTPDLESFDISRKNLKVGVAVEGIARFLIVCRARITDIPTRSFHQDREVYNNILQAAESMFKTRKFQLTVSSKQAAEGFEQNQRLFVNGIPISSSVIQPSRQIQVVIANLKVLGFHPRPGDRGEIMVDYKLSGGLVAISLKMKVSPVGSHQYNVKITTVLPRGASLLTNKTSRDQLMTQCELFMVSLALVDDTNDLEVCRYQLADTMDRDELEQHMALVAGASAAINGK